MVDREVKQVGLRKESDSIQKGISRTDALVAAIVVVTCVYSAYLYAESQSKKALLFVVVSIVLLMGLWLLYRFAFCRIEKLVSRIIFPISLSVLAIASALFFPAGSIPDEPFHFYRSYEFANMITGQDAHSVRVEDSPLFSLGEGMSTGITDEAWRQTADHIFDKAETGTFSAFDVESVDEKAIGGPYSLADYLPQQKLPSAVGIILAKSLGLNYMSLFYLGRIFNAIYGIALIVAAVRIIPIGKNAMMVVALLPMTIHLMGSYSYDVGTIGLAFLATALIVRLAISEKVLSAKDIAPSLIALFLLAPCKVVYSCVVLLFFALGKKRFPSRGKRFACWAAAIGVVIFAILAVRAPSLLGLVSGGAGDSEYYTLSAIVGDPLSSAAMLVRTLETFGWFWLTSIAGGSLGWFQADIAFPVYVPVGLLGILCLSSIRCTDDDFSLSFSVRTLAVLAFSLCAFFVILSMWTGWTASDEIAIQGVQGRYFIPLLPLLLVGMRPNKIKAGYRFGFPLIAVVSSTTFIGFSYISAACAVL